MYPLCFHTHCNIVTARPAYSCSTEMRDCNCLIVYFTCIIICDILNKNIPTSLLSMYPKQPSNATQVILTVHVFQKIFKVILHVGIFPSLEKNIKKMLLPRKFMNILHIEHLILYIVCY